jgi:hypothetical protein
MKRRVTTFALVASIVLLQALVPLTLLGAVAYIAWHFVQKFW